MLSEIAPDLLLRFTGERWRDREPSACCSHRRSAEQVACGTARRQKKSDSAHDYGRVQNRSSLVDPVYACQRRQYKKSELRLLQMTSRTESLLGLLNLTDSPVTLHFLFFLDIHLHLLFHLHLAFNRQVLERAGGRNV